MFRRRDNAGDGQEKREVVECKKTRRSRRIES